MYTRKLTEPPASLVKKGKPVFGNYSRHPASLDIRNVYRPVGIFPLPTFITNLRIKSRLSFFFNLGPYLGTIDFFDAKIFTFAEVCFWNTGTKQKFAYRSVMGPRFRLIPNNLEKPSAVISFRKWRYIKISWDRIHNKLSVVFKLKGDSVRPKANAALSSHFNENNSLEYSAVCPAPTMRRCSAYYLSAHTLQGSISIKKKNEAQKLTSQSDGIALFDMNRIYSRYRTHGEQLTGLGEIKGKPVVFFLNVSSQEANDCDNYNTNVLFYDGQTIPLPPVTITHNSGTMNKWNIQDTENMVDLSFTPAAENMHKHSIFILRTQYRTIYGSFEGVLLTPSGEKIVLHGFSGLAKKFLLRL